MLALITTTYKNQLKTYATLHLILKVRKDKRIQIWYSKIALIMKTSNFKSERLNLIMMLNKLSHLTCNHRKDNPKN